MPYSQISTRGHRATHRATSSCPVPVACRPGPAACRRSEGARGHAGQRADTGRFSETNCFSAERGIVQNKQIKAAAARSMRYVVTYFQIRYRCQAWMWMLRAVPCNYRSELPRGLRRAAAACRGPAVHPTAANPKRQHFYFFFFFHHLFLHFKDANEFCPPQPRSWFEEPRAVEGSMARAPSLCGMSCLHLSSGTRARRGSAASAPLNWMSSTAREQLCSFPCLEQCFSSCSKEEHGPAVPTAVTGQGKGQDAGVGWWDREGAGAVGTLLSPAGRGIKHNE